MYRLHSNADTSELFIPKEWDGYEVGSGDEGEVVMLVVAGELLPRNATACVVNTEAETRNTIKFKCFKNFSQTWLKTSWVNFKVKA